MYSMQIENNVGFPSRAPILVVKEYDHWKVGMEKLLRCKEKKVKKYGGLSKKVLMFQ